MKVKICGITDLETALFAVESGADALGFVFAPSKRRIDIQKAKKIIAKVPTHVLTVGVFVNEEIEVVHTIIEETGINTVQLHGDEPPEYCQQIAVPVIKAFSISSKMDLIKSQDFSCHFILVDSPKGAYRGGSGQTFDWNLLINEEFNDKKLVLAGGLNAENISSAINIVDPYMIDVSSGVETDGKKDFKKIKQFIDSAKHGQRRKQDDYLSTTK